MRKYSVFDAPIKVYGIPFFDEKKEFSRLPVDLVKKFPHLLRLSYRCAGVRVAFKTNASIFTIKIFLNTMTVDVGMSIYAAQSAQVLVGERFEAKFLGIVNPSDYNTKIFEQTFEKSNDLEQVTIYLPRNEQIENIEIFIPDDAVLEEPTPYKYDKHVVFYGSSITEGCCCCNLTNAYTTLLSNWLDFDFYNLGLAGNAKGEIEIADFINTLDMRVFVYDYDHNAPTLEHLKATHKPFFERIRNANPDLPIIMMTRPAETYTDDMKARRKVIESTYNEAIAKGDKNVYFIDGENFYGDKDRYLCSIDGIHPNDLGFYRMASVIRPIIEKIL